MSTQPQTVEGETSEERARRISAEILADPEIARQLRESREAEERGDHGISAKEYFAKRG